MIYHWKSHSFCQEAGSNFKGALDWLVRKTSLTQAAVPRHGLDPIVMNLLCEKRCRFVVFEDLDQIEIGDISRSAVNHRCELEDGSFLNFNPQIIT